MDIYCLFCEPGSAKYVRAAMPQIYPCRAISPKTIQHRRKPQRRSSKDSPNEQPKKTEYEDVERDLLPNYVFLYFEEEKAKPYQYYLIDGVIRCLRDSSGQYELTGPDRDFALMLLEKDGVIGKTEVYEEGDRIRIREGAFLNVETQILKVDRRSHRIQIELPFAGRPVRTWVEYEMIEKSNPS